MDIIKYKNWFFGLSLLVIVPGVISLILWHLNLSIDFTGGTQMKWIFSSPVSSRDLNQIKSVLVKDNVKLISMTSNDKNLQIRTNIIDQNKHQQILLDVRPDKKNFQEEEFSTIGPTIGSETTKNAFLGIIIASVLIVLYIAWSFREVPKPASSLRFGICAIIALLHDCLVLLGIFSLLGHFLNIEVDSLFVTAVLTVIGFSVHDTIVVFDRIRENLKRQGSMDFAKVVNNSIFQTMTRSLNTSLTVIFVLFTLLLFGGESTRWFVVALLVGIISGTYSSIFNASPLLVLWNEISNKRN